MMVLRCVLVAGLGTPPLPPPPASPPPERRLPSASAAWSCMTWAAGRDFRRRYSSSSWPRISSCAPSSSKRPFRQSRGTMLLPRRALLAVKSRTRRAAVSKSECCAQPEITAPTMPWSGIFEFRFVASSLRRAAPRAKAAPPCWAQQRRSTVYTMRLGAHRYLPAISSTRRKASGACPASKCSFTRIEKVMFEGDTRECSMSSKTRRPSWTLFALAQPSMRLLYMISSHFRPRDLSSFDSARALCTSPVWL
mmetsp:Transcript_61835/g.174263  ORF Transcript_61835/g.174263 Transcript_61835/m.174263 type:complete len:251 (+) Transcript_61835:639-1391(+)